MKKMYALAVAALCVSMTATAQIGESKSQKIETTYTTTTRTLEVQPNKNYNRIIFGWAPTKFKTEGDSETLQGFNLGWTGGYNVTKGKRLPLYFETGLTMNADFGECRSKSDKLLNFEIPMNITYRYNFKNTKIYVAPYFGFHFKINAMWRGENSRGKSVDYFDADGTNRFQFGMQLGVNFDINRFNIGFGWDNDFMPITKVNGYKLKTSGARINIGVTF